MTNQALKPGDRLRILIIAEHTSMRFGGEAALPAHYFRVLTQRELPVWLMTHARVRPELERTFHAHLDRIHFIEDNWFHRLMWKVGDKLPARLAYFSTGLLSRLFTQWQALQIARGLVSTHGIDIVHQPIPVSPKEPSLLSNLGAPLVIGPMNGGMDYPPAFSERTTLIGRVLVYAGRQATELMHLVIPGKRRAGLLLVANERTRAALPRICKSPVDLLVENGVDLELWRTKKSLEGAHQPPNNGPCVFVFMGRLVDWKAVDLLLEAFAQCSPTSNRQLLIVGDGPERSALEDLADRLGLLNKDSTGQAAVSFLGWLDQQECAKVLGKADAMILPSLMECGGAVVLEAMAAGLPVIATDWGGPADYLDERCGILVKPSGKDCFTTGLAEAIDHLARNPQIRLAMGKEGRRRVETVFNWDSKVDQILGLFEKTIKDDHSGQNGNSIQ